MQKRGKNFIYHFDKFYTCTQTFQQDLYKGRFFRTDFQYNRLYRENIELPDCQRNLTDKRIEADDRGHCIAHCGRKHLARNTG